MNEDGMNPPPVSLSFTLNGQAVRISAPTGITMSALIRDHLGLRGTKEGCHVGECGACTVLVDDAPVLSCLMLAAELDGRHVTTIESEADKRVEQMRTAFLAESALQCGFCTPGMILTASRIVPDASPDAIRAALVGNICRCTGYASIVRAVQRAQSTPSTPVRGLSDEGADS